MSASASEEPQLLPQHAHRALLYVEKLNTVGVHPQIQDVEAFARSAAPREAQYRSALATGLAPMQTITSRSVKVADAQPVTDWLLQMRWLTIDGDQYLALSDLGAALLAALRLSPPEWSLEREGASAVVLRPDDPFVYWELTRSISEAGSALLVDPYFKADMLDWLHNATLVTRLLLSAASPQQAREVEQIKLFLNGINDTPNAGRVEVRASKSGELHDRCIVQQNGQVLLLGTSITGIGRHLSTIIPMPTAGAIAMRGEIERLWQGAETVEPEKIRRPDAGTNRGSAAASGS